MKIQHGPVGSCLASLLLILATIAPAGAATIDFDIGAYAGAWRLNGGALRYGSGSAELDPGRHYLAIGSSAVPIDVLADGSVQYQGPASLVTNGSTLSFQTVDVTIQRNGFTGAMGVFGVRRHIGADDPVEALVPGLNYTLGGSRWASSFSLTASEVSGFNPTYGTNSGLTISLNTLLVSVDAAGYDGFWVFGDAMSGWNQNSGSAWLIAGVSYKLYIGARSAVSIDLSASGELSAVGGTHPDWQSSLSVNGLNIQLNTTPVTIDPNGFVGSWALHYAALRRIGGQATTLTLVKGVEYQFGIGFHNTFSFDVGADGLPTAAPEVPLAVNGSTVSMQTISVTVSASDQNAAWQIWEVMPTTQGDQVVTLVPMAIYRFNTPDGTRVDSLFGSDCIWSVNPIELNALTLNLSCPDDNPLLAVVPGPTRIHRSASANSGGGRIDLLIAVDGLEPVTTTTTLTIEFDGLELISTSLANAVLQDGIWVLDDQWLHLSIGPTGIIDLSLNKIEVDLLDPSDGATVLIQVNEATGATTIDLENHSTKRTLDWRALWNEG